jgi:hypothetical protein
MFCLLRPRARRYELWGQPYRAVLGQTSQHQLSPPARVRSGRACDSSANVENRTAEQNARQALAPTQTLWH